MPLYSLDNLDKIPNEIIETICNVQVSHPIETLEELGGLNYTRGFIFFQLDKRFSNRAHNGIDIAVPVGSKIRAVRSGIVGDIKWDSGQVSHAEGGVGFGLYLVIYYQDGYSGYYAHLLPGGIKVEEGQAINTGDIIALSGNSGDSTGPHLHYGEKDSSGNWINPVMVILQGHLQDYPDYPLPIFLLKYKGVLLSVCNK